MIDPRAVPDDALVAEAGGMGAPTVGLEKLDAFECESALQAHADAGQSLGHAVLYCSVRAENV